MQFRDIYLHGASALEERCAASFDLLVVMTMTMSMSMSMSMRDC